MLITTTQSRVATPRLWLWSWISCSDWSVTVPSIRWSLLRLAFWQWWSMPWRSMPTSWGREMIKQVSEIQDLSKSIWSQYFQWCWHNLVFIGICTVHVYTQYIHMYTCMYMYTCTHKLLYKYIQVFAYLCVKYVVFSLVILHWPWIASTNLIGRLMELDGVVLNRGPLIYKAKFFYIVLISTYYHIAWNIGSPKIWRLGFQYNIIVIFAEFKFGSLRTTVHKHLWIVNLVVRKRIAKPPNCQIYQIFQLYITVVVTY